MALLATAHLADDLNQSFIPALLPYLILERHLSHQTAGTLVLCQAMSSSVIQPAIGHLADRRSMPWLIAVGLLLAGGGVAALGVLPTMPLLFLAALISGIGVAMFHPEAARFANWVAGDQKASGMRWFTVGGNLGFAVGPAFATAAISLWGLHGTLAAAIPVALVAGVVLLELRRLATFIPNHVKQRKSAGTDDWVSFGKLSAFVIVRSMAYLGSVAFLPLYFVEVLHTSPAVGDAALVAYLLSGALGTIAGGPIADRVGRIPVMLWSTGLTVVLFVTFVALTHGGAPAAARVRDHRADGLRARRVAGVVRGARPGVSAEPRRARIGRDARPRGVAGRRYLARARRDRGRARRRARRCSPSPRFALAATLIAFTLPGENRRQRRAEAGV